MKLTATAVRFGDAFLVTTVFSSQIGLSPGGRTLSFCHWMLKRLLAIAVSFLGLFVVCPISVASADPKYGDVPLRECPALLERFARIHPPANAKLVSHALKDSRWLSQAAIDPITFLAGWIPISRSLFQGSAFEIELTPTISQHNSGYRIYVHTTRAFPKDAAMGFRAFLAGRASSDIAIDEYALCYPDGRILHVDSESRRMIPSTW
jgi:hypothetical protein